MYVYAQQCWQNKITGDFSFAHSLVIQHQCRNVLATCYDTEDALYSKYPQVAEKNIQDIYDAFSKKKKRQSTDDLSGDDGHGHDHDEKEEEEEKQERNTNDAQASNQDQKQEQQQQQQQKHQQHKRQGPKVLFSVDARKLGHPVGGGKDVRMGFIRQERLRLPVWKQQQQKNHNTNKADKEEGGGPWDIICFNFPHVGGLSTDVNRQVRSNQELLVAFFKACVPLLSRSSPESLNDDDDEDEEDYGWENSSDEDSDEDDGEDGGRTRNEVRTEPGQILVTLFEGEPYTLWNIKDLARYAGLKVVTSFKFPWASYEGYSHARTLGHIEGKHGGRGGWKGENREARMYVFERQEDDRGRKPQSSQPDTNSKKKKRSRNESESDDDSD